MGVAVLSEWLQLMLAEIARKQEEEARAREEEERRRKEAGRAEGPQQSNIRRRD